MAEGIEDEDPVVVLAVVQVFGDEFSSATGFCGGENHRVPEGKLEPLAKRKSVPKTLEGVVDDRPVGEILDDESGLVMGLPETDKIDVELLENLDTYGGATKATPAICNQIGCYFALGSGIAIVAVEKNIGVQKAFNGHGFHPA